MAVNLAMVQFEITDPSRRGRIGITYALLEGTDVVQLLDYGCGDASFAVGVAGELGLTVHACDIDSEQVMALQRRYGATVNFFTVSETEPQLPLRAGQVSAATCCDVLEHMPAALRPKALREMRRVLTDDGVLVVTTPHKGLFSAADPENAKFHFPRLHKCAYSLTRGRDEYERVYGGGGRFGNFSHGVTRHVHFSTGELSELITSAGFEIEEIRYFGLLYPFIKTLLWFSESLAGRVWAARRLTALLLKVYSWDAGLEPGRLACFIGIRARCASSS